MCTNSCQRSCQRQNFRLKIHTSAKAFEAVWSSYDRSQKRVVFTNGCFDILHAGHVDYLEKARMSGDFLIVGLNSDASVVRLNKGPGRPIQTESDRAAVLAALQCVDFVLLFGEDTPLELIKVVKPDVLVKGGDWQVENIVGADFVKARGGQVSTIPFLPGHSTTMIEQKIRAVLAGQEKNAP